MWIPRIVKTSRSFVSSPQLQTQLLKTCCIESKPRLHSMLSTSTWLYSAKACMYVLTLFPNGNLSHTMVTLLTHHTRGVVSGVVALDTMDMMSSVIHFSNSITLGNTVCYLLCNHPNCVTPLLTQAWGRCYSVGGGLVWMETQPASNIEILTC